jgi:FkbH-like protein
LPALFPGAPPRANDAKLHLYQSAYAWAAKLAEHPSVRVVEPEQIDLASPFADRYSARADLASGFPYQLNHASRLSELLAAVLVPPAPLKGLITDLDDTLWRGILGEQGLEGVSWDLDHQSYGHAIYQATLMALAEQGILVAVASKNDPDLVAQAFRELDLIVDREQLFPIEAHWQRKSESVQRILRVWNVGADSVMFIDDSPAELAEVQVAFPNIQTRQFPTGDEASIVRLAEELRRRFGKHQATAEDDLRTASLKANEHFEAAASLNPDDFLAAAEAQLTFTVDQPDVRSYELINKTNQFNLNGIRIDESTWRSWASDPGRFLIAVDYVDKFGPLGKIAVVAGKCPSDGPPTIDTWVMSCRSFSRRIEFQTLQFLLAHLETTELLLHYKATERNGPMREFLTSLLDAPPQDTTVVRQADFERRRPNVFGEVTVQ